MTKDTTKTAAVAADIMLFDNWFDSIEGGVRERVRGFPRYGRHKANGNEKAGTGRRPVPLPAVNATPSSG